MKDEKKVKIGKSSLLKGRRFENKVRKDLESKGWIVSRWQNNVELVCTKVEPLKENPNFVKEVRFIGKLIPARQGRFRKTSTGFPDFVAYKPPSYNTPIFKATKFEIKEEDIKLEGKFLVELIGIECKTNNYLTKEEKEKCKWLLENNIFSKILIASREKVGRKYKIRYEEFTLKQPK